jgi:WD40 repeat protein/Mg-chelatase subunit ChlD
MDILKKGVFMPLLRLIVFLFPFSWAVADVVSNLEADIFLGGGKKNVVYSPDSNTLASSTGNTVQLWNAKKGEIIHTLTRHSGNINIIAFSPNSETLASASDDKSIKLWKVKTGELKHTLIGHSHSVDVMAYSPDGKNLSSASSSWNDRTIKLWNVETGDLKYTLTGHSSWINAIAYSPNGKTLASASDDKTIKLWNVITGELKHTLTGHSRSTNIMAYSPDGKTLASASDDKIIKLWNTKTSKIKYTLTGHSDGINAIAYSPDGKTIASASRDKTIKLWNVETGKLTNTLGHHSKFLAYSPDDSTLAFLNNDSTLIKRWDIKASKLKDTLTGALSPISAFVYSFDGKYLASISNDDSIKIWNTKTNETIHSIIAKNESGILSNIEADIEVSSRGDIEATANNIGSSDSVVEADAHVIGIEIYVRNRGDIEATAINIDVNNNDVEENSGIVSISIDSSEMTIVTSENNYTAPLPHNGLFTRRNNAFGTKQNTSLKELIAQGVMIEQEKIRFDDFVALNTDGIPLPKNNALAVSHGIATIPAYQKRDDRATHYLEIALKTADVAPIGHPETKAPPVNYIFVVDVSGSMEGEKIDTVKAAIRELFTRLRADDVIGVVAFDHQAQTLLESTPKQRISPSDFGKMINRLNVRGSTDINLALSISIDEMKRYRGAQKVNQLFLFSDGNPTSGETDWIKIRQNIAAKLRQNTATDGNIRLSTFVFGTDANKVELDRLAGITGGQSTFVIEPKEDVRHSLQQELARRTHLAAINVQMQIEIAPNIDILHFYGHDLITNPATRAAIERDADLTGKKVEKDYGVKPQPDLIKEDKGIRVFVPNLAVGETYWVVFELAVPEQHKSADFGKATVQYFDTFAHQNQKPQFALSKKGPIAPQWVTQHALGLWTSEVASYALYDVEANDLATAEKRINAHISILETARTHLTPKTPVTSVAPVKLVDDIITLTKFLSLAKNLNQGASADNVRVYLNHGLKELESSRNGFVRRVEYGSE